MNFELNEEQLAVQAAARGFAQKQCLEGVIERDTHMTHPTELLKQMGELGFMGMMVDPKYNGGGYGYPFLCFGYRRDFESR